MLSGRELPPDSYENVFIGAEQIKRWVVPVWNYPPFSIVLLVCDRHPAFCLAACYDCIDHAHDMMSVLKGRIVCVSVARYQNGLIKSIKIIENRVMEAFRMSARKMSILVCKMKAVGISHLSLIGLVAVAEPSTVALLLRPGP